MSSIMIPSTYDDATLTAAIVLRLGYLGKVCRIAEIQLEIPSDMIEFKMFNSLARRRKRAADKDTNGSGLYEYHTADEARAQQVVAEWIVAETKRVTETLQKNGIDINEINKKLGLGQISNNQRLRNSKW